MAGTGEKILVISYYWPPSGGPGALRMTGWVKYLARAGWEPRVLTVENGEFPYPDPGLSESVPPDVSVHRVRAPQPFGLYKRLTGRKPDDSLPVGLLAGGGKGPAERIAGWIRANVFIPDARTGWVGPATREAARLIRSHGIRHVLISSPPHSAQLIGLRLRKRTDVRWIADLRDPWTGFRHYQTAGRSRTAARCDARLERRVLRHADRVTTVSPALAGDFERLGALRGRVHVLLNGFDPDDFGGEFPALPRRFRIVHTGNLVANQNPGVLWDGLSRLCDALPGFASHLEIRLTGRVHPVIEEAIRIAGLSDALVLNPFRPHREILPEITGASVLLVVIPQTENNRGIVTGKLPEYIGSGRPVLVIGPADGDAAGIVRPLSNGWTVDYGDAEGCRDVLESLFRRWQADDLPVSEAGEREPFSRAAAVETLIGLMRDPGP
ncbi:MAG TPA: glycosyl transferase family 1 [bacterium]|nr:glycosyl transferase family 1 [bacterium]